MGNWGFSKSGEGTLPRTYPESTADQDKYQEMTLILLTNWSMIELAM